VHNRQSHCKIWGGSTAPAPSKLGKQSLTLLPFLTFVTSWCTSVGKMYLAGIHFHPLKYSLTCSQNYTSAYNRGRQLLQHKTVCIGSHDYKSTGEILAWKRAAETTRTTVQHQQSQHLQQINFKNNYWRCQLHLLCLLLIWQTVQI